MTNYERISSMTIDEMAEFLCHGDFDCDKCAYKDDEEGCRKEVGNYKRWLERVVRQPCSNSNTPKYIIDKFGIAGRLIKDDQSQRSGNGETL